MIEIIFVWGILMPLSILAWGAALFLTTCGLIHLHAMLQKKGIL